MSGRCVNDVLGGPGRNRTTDTRIFNPSVMGEASRRLYLHVSEYKCAKHEYSLLIEFLFDSHRLRQITGLVHIRTTRQRGVIRQQLQSSHVQDRRQQTVVFRQADHVQAIP